MWWFCYGEAVPMDVQRWWVLISAASYTLYSCRVNPSKSRSYGNSISKNIWIHLPNGSKFPLKCSFWGMGYGMVWSMIWFVKMAQVCLSRFWRSIWMHRIQWHMLHTLGATPFVAVAPVVTVALGKGPCWLWSPGGLAVSHSPLLLA